MCTLKNSEKYFQIFHKKIKLKINIFKNSKFSFKWGIVPRFHMNVTFVLNLPDIFDEFWILTLYCIILKILNFFLVWAIPVGLK